MLQQRRSICIHSQQIGGSGHAAAELVWIRHVAAAKTTWTTSKDGDDLHSRSIAGPAVVRKQ